jgi:hypothetical protein
MLELLILIQDKKDPISREKLYADDAERPVAIVPISV